MTVTMRRGGGDPTGVILSMCEVGVGGQGGLGNEGDDNNKDKVNGVG